MEVPGQVPFEIGTRLICNKLLRKVTVCRVIDFKISGRQKFRKYTYKVEDEGTGVIHTADHKSLGPYDPGFLITDDDEFDNAPKRETSKSQNVRSSRRSPRSQGHSPDTCPDQPVPVPSTEIAQSESQAQQDQSDSNHVTTKARSRKRKSNSKRFTFHKKRKTQLQEQVKPERSRSQSVTVNPTTRKISPDICAITGAKEIKIMVQRLNVSTSRSRQVRSKSSSPLSRGYVKPLTPSQRQRTDNDKQTYDLPVKSAREPTVLATRSVQKPSVPVKRTSARIASQIAESSGHLCKPVEKSPARTVAQRVKSGRMSSRIRESTLTAVTKSSASVKPSGRTSYGRRTVSRNLSAGATRPVEEFSTLVTPTDIFKRSTSVLPVAIESSTAITTPEINLTGLGSQPGKVSSFRENGLPSPAPLVPSVSHMSICQSYEDVIDTDEIVIEKCIVNRPTTATATEVGENDEDDEYNPMATITTSDGLPFSLLYQNYPDLEIEPVTVVQNFPAPVRKPPSLPLLHPPQFVDLTLELDKSEENDVPLQLYPLDLAKLAKLQRHKVPIYPVKYTEGWSIPKHITNPRNSKSYELGSFLGNGAYGLCFQATRRQDAKKFGCKVQYWHDKHLEIDCLKAEIELWKEVNHPNIVKLEESFVFGNSVYLLMDLCIIGSLAQAIDYRLPPLSHTKYFAKQLFCGLEYLHTKALIAHLDIKPENLLLDQAMTLKICDFGLSAKLFKYDYEIKEIGSANYISPELIKGVTSRNVHLAASDIWSAGVVIVTLLQKIEPFRAHGKGSFNTLKRLTFRNIEAIKWNKTEVQKADPDAIQLLDLIFVSAEKRITATEALKYPFLSNDVPAQVPILAGCIGHSGYEVKVSDKMIKETFEQMRIVYEKMASQTGRPVNETRLKEATAESSESFDLFPVEVYGSSPSGGLGYVLRNNAKGKFLKDTSLAFMELEPGRLYSFILGTEGRIEGMEYRPWRTMPKALEHYAAQVDEIPNHSRPLEPNPSSSKNSKEITSQSPRLCWYYQHQNSTFPELAFNNGTIQLQFSDSIIIANKDYLASYDPTNCTLSHIYDLEKLNGLSLPKNFRGTLRQLITVISGVIESLDSSIFHRDQNNKKKLKSKPKPRGSKSARGPPKRSQNRQ